MIREQRQQLAELRGQEERRQIAERARGRVPENERQNFADWVWGLAQRGNELGILTLENGIAVTGTLV